MSYILSVLDIMITPANEPVYILSRANMRQTEMSLIGDRRLLDIYKIK